MKYYIIKIFSHQNIKSKSCDKIKNGVIYLKGGDLEEELLSFPRAEQILLSTYFDSDFFQTKKILR